jgi:hypothetical protein
LLKEFPAAIEHTFADINFDAGVLIEKGRKHAKEGRIRLQGFYGDTYTGLPAGRYLSGLGGKPGGCTKNVSTFLKQ